MKVNTLLIVLIIAVIGGAAFFIIRDRKKKPGAGYDNEIDELVKYIPGTARPRVIPHSGQTFAGMTDMEFFQNLGFGEDFLKTNHSPKDLQIARQYTEQFARKGIRLTKDSPLWSEVDRISKYSPLINRAFMA